MPADAEGYATRLGDRLPGADLGEILAAVARALFDAVDPSGRAAAGAPLLQDRSARPALLGDLDPRVALGGSASEDAPDLLGRIHELLMDAPGRRRRGAFYTPRPVAEGALDVATADWERPLGDLRVCDPSCGGGAFLLASGRLLERQGLGRADVVATRLWGIDVDPLAAAVTDAALRLWAAQAGEIATGTNVVCADGLGAGLDAWSPPREPFDLVLGNPPFQGQLNRRTARSLADLHDLRERLGPVAHGYVDTAVLFLAAGLAMVAEEGGRVALVQPASFLASRDAARSRTALLEGGDLVALWWPGEPLFDVAARVCVPVVERSASRRAAAPTLARWVGPRREAAASLELDRESLRGAPTWGALVADLRGIPSVDLGDAGTLADVAKATAGFRDHFYDLVPYVVEGSDGDTDEDDRPRLITSGLVDPAASLWGRLPARFAGGRFQAPRVDLRRLGSEEPDLAAWGMARLVPKVVVATQTPIVEAAVDPEGTWWPSVPVISVEPEPELVWHVAAVLLAPPVTAWAMARYVGSAQSEGSVKLAASQVLEVPLPSDESSWEAAAALVRQASEAAEVGDAEAWSAALDDAARAMCEAYGAGVDVWSWWRRRRPPSRLATPRFGSGGTISPTS